MQATTYPLSGASASTIAGDIDAVALFVTLVAAFFSLGIFIAVIILTVRYRRGAKVDRANAPLHSVPIEIAWTVIPLIIALGIFGWSAMVFFRQVQVPPGSMEIYVVGKQWMWKLQHPEGKWEMNELHVPAGKPVVLTMTSEDVIHSFYVPAFRLKQDVIPGVYTQLSFTPTKPGTYHLFCAEFCGTYHSTMVGKVVVMEPADYQKWLTTGNVQQSLAERGGELFRQYGCSGCHAANSSVKAPPLEGIYGETVAVQQPKPGLPLEQTAATTAIADNKYIHDSIVLPEKLVAAGYRNIMPSYRNRLTEEQILALVQYIKALGNQSPPPRGNQGGSLSTLTPEDYKARTGFVPENVDKITGGAGATSGAGATTGGNTPGH
ncbi:MAG: cytochrome c oxidase subunit II [Actinomycetota bacterium]